MRYEVEILIAGVLGYSCLVIAKPIFGNVIAGSFANFVPVITLAIINGFTMAIGTNNNLGSSFSLFSVWSSLLITTKTLFSVGAAVVGAGGDGFEVEAGLFWLLPLATRATSGFKASKGNSNFLSSSL